MARAEDEQLPTLVQSAQDRLRGGASPRKVFVELATDSGDLHAVAIAVCMAAGTGHEDAEKRWATDGEPLLAEAGDDDEAFLGKVLEMTGFFDFHRPLDDHDQQIRDLLGQAFDAHGGWKSGAGLGLLRKLQTGRFVDALESMAGNAPRSGALSPSAYWNHLLAAADMLASTDDARIEPIALLCRRHLEESSAAGTDSGG